MNKIYKVVWSKVKHCYVVTSELAKRNGKGCGARSLRMAAATLGVAAALLGGFSTTTEAKRYEIKIDNVDVTNNLERVAGIYTFQGATKTLTVDQTMIDQKTGSNKYFYGNVVGPSGKSVMVTVIDGEIVTITDYYSPFAQQVINERPFNDSGELQKDGAITTVGALVQAGPGASANVSGYSVTLSGTGLVDVAGALSYGGSVSNNSLTVNGGAVTGDVYGGTTTSGDASYNAVTINSGTVSSNTYGKGNVYGGNSYYGNTSYNAVTVNGGTVTGNTYSNGNVYGGNTSSGEATYNTVTITGGTISQVYGGNSNLNATNNTVTVQGGTVGSVTGAYSSKEANNNTVNVSKGTVGTSAGSYAVVGAANDGTSSGDPVSSGNHVTVTGTAQVTGLVIGARDAYYAAVITDNTVTIDGSAVVTGDVFGGYGWHKDKTQNRVYVNSGTVTGNVYGVELNSSYSSDTGNATSNEVHISGGTVSGSVYGGAVKGKVSGNANSNKVEISGGEVKASGTGSGDTVYGGYSETGHANSNKVQVSGESIIKLTVYGGVSKYEEGTANNNEVTVSDSAKLPSGITAGWSPNKDAKNNTVTIEGGTVQGYIDGGVATGAADNNHIIVNGGKVSYLEGGAGGSSATGNTVEINGGKVTDTIFGGYSGNGTVTGNTVTVNGGTVSTIFGGYSLNGTVTGNTVTVVSDAVLDGAVYGGMNGTGDANGNTVSITSGTVGGAVWGGYSNNGDANNNTVIVKDMAAGRAIYGGYAANLAKNAAGNTVSIKNVTAPAAYHNLEGGYTDYTAKPTGDFVTGNTLIISGANKFGGVIDNFETIKLADDFAWKNGATVLQGKFGVNYDGTRPALDITDAETALSSATSGSMTLLASSSANDFSTLSLKYSGGSATLDSSKLSQVVLSGEGSASEDKGVTVISSSTHTISLDQANSFKNVLYSVESGLASKISLGEMAWESPRALTGFTFGSAATVDAANLTFTGKTTTPLKVNDSRTLVSGATGIASLPATNITQPNTGKGTVAIEYTDANNLKFNATASGRVGVVGTDVKYSVTGVAADSVDLSGWKGTTASAVPSGWTGAGVAVSGSFTEPEIEVNSKKDIVTGAASGFFTEVGIADAIKYKEGAGFTGDEANGVTLAGKQSKGVQAADGGKKLVYAAGAKEVTEVTLGNMAAGAPRTMDAGYDFAGVTTINAGSLQFDKPEEVKTDAVLVANAAGLAAGKTVTGKDHAQNFTKTAENQVVLSASLKGTVETVAGAVNYKYGGTELTKVDLANWNGASSDASSVTDGWTLGTGASVTTGDLSKAGLTLLKPGETKTILTVGDTIAFTDAMISGAKKWQDGGPIDDSADTSGVKIAGSTTGGGVKVNDSNAHQLIYQQDKKEVTSLTIGSVAYDTSKAVRTFGNGDDLTAAAIDASGFSLSNLDTVKADMKAGDTMVIVDAAKAIKGTGGATLKDFAKQNAGDAIKFSDKIAETVLTFSGTHQDTLEQNDAKTQIIYKVGDKIVSDVAFDGSVTWNDSAAYYENKADADGKFAYTFNSPTNVDAENLKVTGSTTKALKTGDAMTLLSATGMTADTVTDQSDANKTASKVAVNYKDDKGITFIAEAKGEVKTEAAAVKYNINEVKLTDVDLSAWTGTESAVPETWTAEDGSVKVATGSFAAPEVGAGTSKNILTASGAFFADENISGANKYDEANGKAFSETKNNVTVSGTQAKGVTTANEGKSLVYKVGIKKADTVALGAMDWQKGATLFDGSGATEYDYANVTAVDVGKFDVTYDDGEPETVAAGDSMTLLKANKTLKDMAEQAKAKDYSFTPVEGVSINATLTGNLAAKDGVVTYTAAENRASQLTFGDVEWKNSGALMTRPSNIIFAGADVDTSKINFYKEMYLEADRTMTLVSDFGDSVGTITGSKYLVGTAFEGEGEASLSGSDLIFTTKTEAGVSEQTHKAVMAAEANMALLKTGNEYVGKVMDGLSDIANMGRDGISTMAAIGGGASRYETGSHVNTRTWNAAVAIGRRNETKKGTVEYGIFGEYGKGNYTLHSDVGRSDGDAHYAGGGLMAKFTNKHDVYTEASFRLGRMSDSANDLLRDGAGNAYGYDIHANYFGAHIGVGKVIKYDKGKSLDVYGKYFYTKRDGAKFDALQHYNLDSVKSSVLRIGARYGTTNKLWNWYGGLAYEYEFDGEAEGTIRSGGGAITAIRSASVKGSSVRGELGLRMEASKTNPWQTDINIYGYGGKHRGFGGNVSVAYMF